mmetsp:Transcript_1553/g.4941  ORF Transcript_1553/g.4941 Transcript_1553/m.4941 type:complete len:279 (-) Transcript_1553:1062-1898(-)
MVPLFWDAHRPRPPLGRHLLCASRDDAQSSGTLQGVPQNAPHNQGPQRLRRLFCGLPEPPGARAGHHNRLLHRLPPPRRPPLHALLRRARHLPPALGLRARPPPCAPDARHHRPSPLRHVLVRPPLRRADGNAPRLAPREVCGQLRALLHLPRPHLWHPPPGPRQAQGILMGPEAGGAGHVLRPAAALAGFERRCARTAAAAVSRLRQPCARNFSQGWQGVTTRPTVRRAAGPPELEPPAPGTGGSGRRLAFIVNNIGPRPLAAVGGPALGLSAALRG